MTKKESLLLIQAQTLLCDIKTIQLDDVEYQKWNKGTLIIADLLENYAKKKATR